MTHVWIIEMESWESPGEWQPTIGAALTEDDAERELVVWAKRNPEYCFRVCRYEPKRSAKELDHG